MSSTAVLGYQSPTYAWKPPADVVHHNAQPLPPGLEFFQTPPAEIGTLITAHCTLREGKQPFPLIARLLLIVLLPAAALFGADVWAQQAGRNGRDLILVLGLILAALAAILAWYFTRFAHVCSYVGEQGVARFTLARFRGNTPKQQLFLFKDAAELRTGQTRQYVNGVYSGTNYHFVWTDDAGKTVFKLKGRYSSKDGTPKQKDPFWLAAAERAWSVFEVDRMAKQLEAVGYVHFNLGGANFVRVGHGFFEFGTKGEVARINADEIKSLSLKDGQFSVHHKDAKWFSRKGKFNFPYAQMANARLFLLAIEKLLGYRFG
jgi:hypothetical protein